MVRRFILFEALLFGLCVISPVAIAAQERAPHQGSTAVGMNVGAFAPFDDQFDNALVIGALYEYYLTPRLSLRTDLGWTDPGLTRETDDSLRQIPLTFGLHYNWERIAWHPFVGAGVGVYFLQGKDNGRTFGESETQPGVNLGGGLEYFFRPRLSVTGEGRFHAIADTRTGQDPSGFALTVGFKRYW
jgi:opacity protein-like surface antigen